MNTIKAYFDFAAAKYKSRGERGVWRFFRHAEERVIRQLLGPLPLGDVLELGCGAGYYTRILHSIGCHSLVCMDFSKAMFREFSLPGCQKILANIDDNPIKNRFNLILGAGILEFLPNPEKTILYSAGLLKEGGVLIILVSKRSFVGYLYKLFYIFHGISIRLFSENELLSWTKKAGLKAVQTKNITSLSFAVKFVYASSRPKA